MRLFHKLGFASPLLALAILPVFAATSASASESPATGKMAVTRLVLAHGVEAREPQSVTTEFDAKNDRVYAFVEVDNKTRSDKTISVVFEPPTGPAFAEIPLKVGDGHFRTWAFTRRAHEKGEWAVVVRSGDQILGRQTFTVK